MKNAKILLGLLLFGFLLLTVSCTDTDDGASLYDNQIDSVDLSKVKRPGSGEN